MKPESLLDRALRVGERRERMLREDLKYDPIEAAEKAIDYRVGWYAGYMAAKRDAKNSSE